PPIACARESYAGAGLHLDFGVLRFSEVATDLRRPEAPVPTEGANRGDLSRSRPTRDRLRVHAEHRGNLRRGEKGVLCAVVVHVHSFGLPAPLSGSYNEVSDTHGMRSIVRSRHFPRPNGLVRKSTGTRAVSGTLRSSAALRADRSRRPRGGRLLPGPQARPAGDYRPPPPPT